MHTVCNNFRRHRTVPQIGRRPRSDASNLHYSRRLALAAWLRYSWLSYSSLVTAYSATHTPAADRIIHGSFARALTFSAAYSAAAAGGGDAPKWPDGPTRPQLGWLATDDFGRCTSRSSVGRRSFDADGRASVPILKIQQINHHHHPSSSSTHNDRPTF